MRICSIGRAFTEGAVKYIDLESTASLLDFDIAIFDLVALAGSQQAHNHMSRRRVEVFDLLSLGRTVVALVGHFQLDILFPVSGVMTVQSVGNRMAFRGPEQLREFWSAISGSVTYQAYLKGPCGKPFVVIAETDKAVASWVQYERGNLILLPNLPTKYAFNSPEYRVACAVFIDGLLKLDQRLRPKKIGVELPAWSTQYSWSRDSELRSTLGALQEQVEALSGRISTVSVDLQKEERLKSLFTSKGDDLVAIAMEVFRELGAKVAAGEPGRDDIIIEFDAKHAVLEVKGKKGSAAEADAAQLEKWVAGFKEDKGIDAKGILLVDAFCEMPVAERREPAFPHQMLKYSTQREHCLLTTTQLLGLLLAARNEPAKRAELVDGLFTTVGVYPHFSDYTIFLRGPTQPPTQGPK